MIAGVVFAVPVAWWALGRHMRRRRRRLSPAELDVVRMRREADREAAIDKALIEAARWL